MSKSIICIPCYNCAEQLKRLIPTLVDQDLEFAEEVVFINNKSNDETARVIRSSSFSVLKEKGLKVSLIDNKENYGLGGSFKIAVNYAGSKRFDSLIWFHGDDQADSRDINNLYTYFNKSNVDCVFGARFMDGSELVNYSWLRDIGNKVLNFIYAKLLKTQIYELGSGLNIYRVKPILEADINRWPDHIAFDLNLLFLFIMKRNSYSWFPIRWDEKDQVSNANNITVALRILYYLSLYLMTNNYILLPNDKPFDYSRVDL